MSHSGLARIHIRLGIALAILTAIKQIGNFEFLPGDALGEYTVELLSQDFRLLHYFTLQDVS